MKKILVLIVVSILLVGCKFFTNQKVFNLRNRKENFEEQVNKLTEEKEKLEDRLSKLMEENKKNELDAQLLEKMTEYKHCNYSYYEWDSDERCEIVLGNENFDFNSNILYQNGIDLKYVCFDIGKHKFEPSIYYSSYDFERSFELSGYYYENSTKHFINIKEIYLKIHEDKTITIKALARTYIKVNGKTKEFKFPIYYNGPAKEIAYIDINEY